MKFRLLLSILVICLMASGVYATNSATATGNWTDASVWSGTGGVPTNDGDEVKIGGNSTNLGLTVTVNTDIGSFSTKKIDMYNNCTLLVTGNGWIGNGREVHVGDGAAASTGTDTGYLTQTGGTVEMNRSGKLQIAYKSTGATAVGVYTISGGTLQGTTSSARMYVGCSSGDGMSGTLVVDGSGGSINFLGGMYIANDSSSASGNTGTGELKFVLEADGSVSVVKVLESIIDSQHGMESAVAVLTIDDDDFTGALDDPLLLVQNSGSSAVVGHFTGLEEGAKIAVGSKLMTLTYQYNSGDGTINDIALIPEPATIALLSLGLFIIRRK